MNKLNHVAFPLFGPTIAVINNPCIRCGKQRQTSREWKEKIKTFTGVSIVVYTETVCPDPACQALVEAKQAELKEKVLERIRDKAARVVNKKTT